MKKHQHDFIRFLIDQKALLFGQFVLKSGRTSPYFFNAGQFNNSAALTKLGHFYADAIAQSCLKYDILFGPAYKGIPILSSVCVALYEKMGLTIPFCFNRKEAKAYGEGGELIGSPLQGHVLIIDDVVSSGTTFRESATLIAKYPTKLVGMVTALDREERGKSIHSATKEIEEQYQIKAVSIVRIRDVIDFLNTEGHNPKILSAILKYQEQYGAD